MLSDWIFGSTRRWVTFCALILLGVGTVPFYLIFRADRTDDAGTYCPNGLAWKMPDDGACYRQCAMAAAPSDHPDYSTEKCARNACVGYTKVCRP